MESTACGKPSINDDSKMRIFIHTGFIAVMNGARCPLAYFRDLSELLGAELEQESSPDRDSFIFNKEDLPICLELLEENNMLYWIPGLHTLGKWKGIKDSWVGGVVGSSPSKDEQDENQDTIQNWPWGLQRG